MNKRFLITVITLLIILAGAGIAIALAKGYTFSPQEGKIVGTGIISVTSTPDGASVYIDGHLTTATNTTISQLVPKKYNIKIVKEGFIPWEKEVDVRGGLVSEVKASLFPALPTIYPLTFNGITSTLMSPDGQKLAFTVPLVNDSHARQKGGVWVWTFTSQPLSLNRGAEPHQLVASTANLDFSKAGLRWSPDSKQLLVTLQEGGQPGEASQRNYLLPFDRQTSIPDLRDITPIVASNLKEWQDDLEIQNNARVLAVPDLKMREVASSSAVVKWSPDETRFIAGDAGSSEVVGGKPAKTPTPSFLKGFKVYDLSIDKSGTQKREEYILPEALAYYWLPDSRHVILVQNDKVEVADFDGSNVAVIFAGSFDKSAVFPWPDSSRLVILTSFNTPTASQPNLFGINLK